MSLLRHGRTVRATVSAGVAAAVLASTGTAYAVWPAAGSGTASTAARALPVPALTTECMAKSIDLTWTTSADQPIVTSFDVHKSIDGSAWAPLATQVATGAGPYTYSDTDIKTMGTYSYRVSARQSEWSTPSAIVSRTMQRGQVKCV